MEWIITDKENGKTYTINKFDYDFRELQCVAIYTKEGGVLAIFKKNEDLVEFNKHYTTPIDFSRHVYMRLEILKYCLNMRNEEDNERD